MSPVTIVTGGSRGIGAAAVRRLAADGHAVCLSFREDADAAEKLVGEVTDVGGRCIAVRADVSNENDVESLFRDAREELGQITGLVANAGVTSPMMPLADQPVSQLRYVLEVNVLGAMMCARRAVQSMSTARGGNGGSIVFVSSSATIHGGPGEYVHYAASKGAIDVLTVGLAKEVAKEGIRVNTVAPGMVDTEIHALSGDPERAWKAADRIPLGRPGDPAEIANAIAWLMTDQASYATGAILRVAGGI